MGDTDRPGMLARMRNALSPHQEPAPEEPPASAPPPVPDSTPRKSSPFAIGFFGAFGVLVAYALSQTVLAVQSILVLVVLSFVLALGASPLVDFLDRHLPRPLALLLLTLTVLGIFALGILALVPLLVEQGTQLINNLPHLLQNLLDHDQVRSLNERYGIIDKLQDAIASARLADQLFNGVLGAGAVVVNVVFSAIITLVLTLYFLGSLGQIKQLVYDLAPASSRDRAKYIADGIFQGISGYVRGMGVEVLLGTVVTFTYLQIMGLSQYAIALAFVYGLLCFIPIVGAPTGAVLVSLVALSTNLTTGIITIVFFVVYQQIDAYVIYPNIMRRAVQVPGVLVVLSAIMGGILMGIIGAILAIPTAAAMLLIWKEVVKPALDAR